MASITRKVTGNLDMVQAVTGHKSIQMAEHYGPLPSNLQGDAVLKVFKVIGS